MVEVILVLGFISVAIGASLLAYNKVNKKSTIQQEIQFANQLKESIQNTYSINGNYNNIDTQEIIDQGLVPENRINNNKILGDFGTNPPVEINISRHTNNIHYFNIRYTNINRKICFDFAEAASRTFTAVTVNGSGSSMYGNGTKVVKFPDENFNPTRAADLCDKNRSYIYLISE